MLVAASSSQNAKFILFVIRKPAFFNVGFFYVPVISKQQNFMEEFEILNLNEISKDVVEIFTSEGNSFYLRLEYLDFTEKERIRIGEKFSDAEKDDIINAGFCFAAEIKATEYLERSEHCRFKLQQKLIQKEFNKSAVTKALDYLEGKNFLNDARYCTAWLRNHSISKYQGRTRLLSELLSRGISNSTAKNAIEEFFTENSELEFCQKAYEKAVQQGKTDDKLMKFLLDSGFSYKLINQVQKISTDSN